MTERTCPICAVPVPALPSPHGGRPPIYCGPQCRRTAEKRVSRHRPAVQWARRMVNMSPGQAARLRAVYGAGFEERLQAARALLQAEAAPSGAMAGESVSSQ